MKPIDRVFSQAAKLPHLPEVVVELERLTRDEDAGSRDIANAVTKDPAVAAKVLRLANSSLYFRAGQIGSIEEAIRIVGVSDFRTMVLSSCIVSAFPLVPHLNLKAHWEHAVATGAIAKAACRPDRAIADAAFTAGLLHSVGVLLMHVTLPALAADVEQRVRGMDFVSRVVAERETLGFDHAEVGAELLRRWKLPSTVCDAVERFPHVDEQDELLPVAVHLGSRLAPVVGTTLEQVLASGAINQRLLEKLRLDQAWLEEDVPASLSNVDELLSTLTEA